METIDTMKARAKKEISPIAPKGSIFIKKGKWGILEGHNKRQFVENKPYKTPNYYPWETIKSLNYYFEIVQNEESNNK